MKTRILSNILIAAFVVSIAFSSLGASSALAKDEDYISAGNQEACSVGLCNEDIPAIIKADDENPIRFRQKYFEKRISGYMEIDEFLNYFDSPSAILFDDKGNHLACHLDLKSDQATLDAIAELDEGDTVVYRGIVKSVAMGRVVHVSKCTLREAKP